MTRTATAHRLAFLAAFTLAGHAPAAAEEIVTIRFAGEFAGNPFSCDTAYEGIGASGATVEVADYRLFVSDVALLSADGTATPVALTDDGKWQTGGVALLDFENGTGSCVNGTPDTNSMVKGTAPAGDYTGLSLTIGVPFDVNHGDPTLAASPLNLTAMFWNWQGGYKFVKLDLSTPGRPLAAMQTASDHAGGTGGGDARARGWSLHLGSTECQSPSRTTPPTTECGNPNRIIVTFDRFDAAENVVVIDPAPVLAAVNVDANTPDTSPGCMSFPNDPDCDSVMPRLGVAYGGNPADPQALVSMR